MYIDRMREADLTVQSCRPDHLAAKQLHGKTTLILGAPCIGTTERLKQLGAQDDVRYVEDLGDEAIKAADDALVIVDHLYESMVAARSKKVPVGEQLSRALDRDGGVCLATRPRTLDWMLQQDESEVPVTAAALDSVDRVIKLRYDLKNNDDVDRGVKRCTELADDIAEDDVRASLDLFRYEGYTFDHDRLDATVSEYSPTLLPSLVGFASSQLADADSGRVLTGSAVLDALGEYGANVGIAETFSFLKKHLSRLDPAAIRKTELGEVLSAARTAVGGMAPSVGAGVSSVTASAVTFGPLLGLGLWLALRDWEDEAAGPDALPVDELIGRIADGTLTPPARERVEAALDLPPGTVDNLTWLGREGNLRRIRAACEEVPELRAEFEAAVEAWADEFETEFDDMAAATEHLAEHTRQASAFGSLVSDILARATGDLSEFEGRARRDEEKLLTGGDRPEEDSGPTMPEMSAVPYYGDEDDRIVEAVCDGGLVVLEGAHGTGKTAAALRAARDLADRNYEVHLPYAWESPEYIEWALTQADGPQVLVTSYRVGTAPFDDRDIKKLLGWVQNGPCHAAIVEVREEFASAFRQQYESREFRIGGEAWRNRERIAFSGLPEVTDDDADSTIDDVIKWVLGDVYGLPPGRLDEAVPAVVDFAEGNAEVAKLAARHIVIEDKPLSAVDTVDDLIWEDIDNVLTDPAADDTPRTQVFRLLSFARSLSLDDLSALADARTGELYRALRDLSGYIEGEEIAALDTGTFERPDKTAEWTISPDIYGEVVFRRVGFGRGELQEFLITLDQVDAEAASAAYPGLALNLRAVYEAGQDRDDDDLSETAVAASEAVFEQGLGNADPESLSRSFRTLTAIPIDFELWRDNRHRVLDAAATMDYEQLGVVQGWLGQSLGATSNRTRLASGGEIVKEYASALANYNERWNTGRFIANVYSTAVRRLTEDFDPDTIPEWLDELADRVSSVATDTRYVQRPHDFLTDVFSLIIWRLGMNYTPSETEAWLDEIEARAVTLATSDVHSETGGLFLADVYSKSVWRLARTFEPDEIAEWLDELADRADSIAISSDHNQSAGQFLMKTYSRILWKMTKASPEEMHNWLNEFDDRAAVAAASNCHEQRPGAFVMNIYSLTVRRLAKHHNPNEVEKWLNELDDRAAAAATDDRHDMDPEMFCGMYAATSLRPLISDSESVASDSWVQALLDRANARYDRNAIIHFYETLCRLITSLETNIDLLADLLIRAENGSLSCMSWADRIQVISVPVARTLSVSVESGVPLVRSEIQRLFSLFGTFTASHSEALATVVIHVTELLDGEEPPVNIPDPPLTSAAARDAFVKRTVAHGLARCTAADGREGLDNLLNLLADLTERTADSRETYVDCLRRAGGLDYADPETAVKLVEVVIDRLAANDTSLDKGTRVEAVAAVTAAVLERTPVGIEPKPPFNAVVAAFDGLSEVNPTIQDTVVAAVADNLESSAHGFDIPTAMAWREATGMET